jgi:hypothetical protein
MDESVLAITSNFDGGSGTLILRVNLTGCSNANGSND